MNDKIPIIWHFDEFLRRHCGRRILTVLYSRVSRRSQRKSGSLRNQHKGLYRAARAKESEGVQIVGQCHGDEDGHQLEDRLLLESAIAKCLTIEAENPDAMVVLLAASRNRILRRAKGNGGSRKDDPPPYDWQMAELWGMLRGVNLATILPPDAAHSLVHSKETSRSDKNGRPPNRHKKPPVPPGTLKNRLKIKKPRVLLVRQRRGWSVREIARYLGLPTSTVGRWIKDA